MQYALGQLARCIQWNPRNRCDALLLQYTEYDIDKTYKISNCNGWVYICFRSTQLLALHMARVCLYI